MNKTKFKTLADVYLDAAIKYKNIPAFLTQKDEQFSGPNFAELYQFGENFAAALLGIGAQAKEHIGIIADNRIEWMIADYGIILAGCASVPRGTDVTLDDISYIYDHADTRIIIIENQKTFEKLWQVKDKLTKLTDIIFLDKCKYQSSAKIKFHQFADLMSKQATEEEKIKIEEQRSFISEEDLFTLIYTSGTTGTPKGVMLTHNNIISQLENIPIEFESGLKVLSILPIWHIFERTFEIICISLGFSTYYTNIKNIRQDLRIVKPQFMASAPRLWESIYHGIQNQVEKKSGLEKGLFSLAYNLVSAKKTSIEFLSGKKIDLTGRNLLFSFFRGIFHMTKMILVWLPASFFDLIVIRKIREATGGRLKGSISGGGALPNHIDRFFNDIGIPVLEGYGMTETSPIISVRTFATLMIGTVGKIYPETEIKIIDINNGNLIFPNARNERAQKGELHVRGPQVMKGYYKNPEATQKVLQNGWINTGDLALITYNGYLKIVGRTKETIVLLNGENVEPVPIENKIQQLDEIFQCMVVGQDQKFLVALLVPQPEIQQQMQHNSGAESEMIRKKLKNLINDLISAKNGFKTFEKIGDILILHKPFEVGDELTAKLSLRRHVITEKYRKEIEKIYSRLDQ